MKLEIDFNGWDECLDLWCRNKEGRLHNITIYIEDDDDHYTIMDAKRRYAGSPFGWKLEDRDKEVKKLIIDFNEDDQSVMASGEESGEVYFEYKLYKEYLFFKTPEKLYENIATTTDMKLKMYQNEVVWSRSIPYHDKIYMVERGNDNKVISF